MKSSKKVSKTNSEWQLLLTPEQYHIARQSGTEPPNGQPYLKWKSEGIGQYHCIACNALLFTSETKINANCGWPAFYDPATLDSVTTKADNSGGHSRIEVNCATCGSHLGHVFQGEGFDTPTDKRYCINALILKFIPSN